MSTRIKELREKQARIVAEARERLDQINAETDEARAKELESSHDKAMAEHDRLEGLIEREEKLVKLEERGDQERRERRPLQRNVDAAGGQDQGDDDPITYRSAFHAMLLAGGNVSDLTSEQRAALKTGVDSKAFERRAQTAGTAAAGGYTVPVELAEIIVRTMKDWGPMYDEQICTVLNTATGNQLNMPTIDDTAVTAEAHTEAAALTDDGGKDATFGQKRLDAYVYDTEFVRFSMELATDSIFNMEALLGSLLGERLARIANAKLTVGTGSSEPNGVVAASSLGKTAAATAAITSDEIIDLLHSVNSAYRRSPKARFMFADTTLAAIRKLKDGQGNYLWQMGDVTTGQPGTLLGYRYSINDDMLSLGAARRVMLFGDFSKYFVRKVGAPMIGVLRERFWPDLGIAGLIRFDGELGDTAAVKHMITAAS